MVNSLTLVEQVRGDVDEGTVGRSRREYLDFIVDGESLRDRLAAVLEDAPTLVDCVPVLVLNWPIGFPAADYGPLIGELPSPLDDGRVPLYVCPECGDLGCGGVTAVIERTEDTVVWRDFGYQNDYEPFDPGDILTGVGPIVFDRQAYEDVLAQFRDRWQAEDSG
ncbi:hypothetical protein [Labedaea rhizosphaerae]|uniref:Oxidoreductase n=1 Tax=Labedaea rhizosphaerae TaxID=598644 RepID=A0A4R6RUL6_LABRH|nr:hypothetical protein [Labedaea rhizosphaerae]TDP90622.1 hypothetical protein EV186_110163 [Labedaea rhizosphaerae]